MSNIHIQNWCQRKGDQFGDHLQSQVTKGKCVFLTAINHQALVAECIQILNVVNETSANETNNFL
jgi:hypothetical protein